MAEDEGRRGGQEAVGHRLAVHFPDDVGLRRLRLRKILVAEGGQARVLENGVHKQAPQHGAAALVTKDIAQGGRVLHNLLSVVETAVRTRTEDAGDAGSVAAEGTGRRHEVAIHLDSLRRQHFRQDLLHHGDMGRRTAAAVEVDADMLHERTVVEHFRGDEASTGKGAERGQQLVLQNLTDGGRSLVDGGDALGLER